MTELQWIESRYQRFCYLYAQAFGNLAAVAYQDYLKSGQMISPKQIAQRSGQLAIAGLEEIELWEERLRSPQPPLQKGGEG